MRCVLHAPRASLTRADDCAERSVCGGADARGAGVPGCHQQFAQKGELDQLCSGRRADGGQNLMTMFKNSRGEISFRFSSRDEAKRWVAPLAALR